MDQLSDFSWPVEMLGRILHFLAMDGASIPWQHLAYLTHNNNALIQLAKKMPRPLVLRIGFDRQYEDKTFILPFQKAAVAHIEIDWGDDSPLQIINDVGEGLAKHEYKAVGEYAVRVFPHGPDVNGSWLNHLGWDSMQRHEYFVQLQWWSPLRSLDSLGSLGIRSLEALFDKARVLDFPLSHLDVSGVCSMRGMFCGALKFNQPIGNWNVSNVTDMSWMFESCTSFNHPLSRWNVGRVTSMRSMFDGAENFNQPIGDWNMSSVTNMRSMFNGCVKFNQDISRWNVSQVRDMSYMFMDAESFNQPIGSWNVSNVSNMESMFYMAESFDQPIGSWDVSSVTNFKEMFCRAASFNQDINDWNVSKTAEKKGMFTKATDFKQRHIVRWNLSSDEIVKMF